MSHLMLPKNRVPKAMCLAGLIAIGLLALLSSVPAFSQGALGAISGTVTDTAGYPLPGAVVTITDTARGTVRTVTTNAAGAYVVPSLIASTYLIKVSTKGFQTELREGLVLDVGQTLSINFPLLVGAVTQTVTVSSGEPLLDVTDAVIGGTLSNKIINNLPLNGRNFLNLLTLRPGVEILPGGGFSTQSENGLPGQAMGFQLDGLRHTEPYNGQSSFNMASQAGDAATILPLDAIETFRVMENPGAQYGGFAGGVVQLALKSGTNQFHGDGYAFGRDSAWDARNYFNPVGTPVLPHSAEQFGGTLGGPIIRTRLFFFVGYEGQRYSIGNAWDAAIPVTGSLAGETPAGTSNCSYTHAGDCNDSIADAEADLEKGGFPLNPVSVSLLKQYPGNNTTSIVVPGGYPNTNRSDNGTAHIDYQVNKDNQLSYDLFIGNQLGNFATSAPIVQPYWRSVAAMTDETMGAHWIRSPNARWVNTLSFGYDDFREPIVPGDESTPATAYGINTGVTGYQSGGMPRVDVASFTPLGDYGQLPKLVGPDFTYDLVDTFYYVHGNHQFNFGAEGTHVLVTADRLSAVRGRLDFNEANLAFPGATQFEDFLAGYPGTGNEIQSGNSNRRVNQWYFAPFFQDDWHAARNLNVNMGLRYDYTTPLSAAGGLLGNFDPNTGLIQQGLNGVGTVYNADPFDISPRLGFAWNPHAGKTVVRGGADLMYTQIDIGFLIGNQAAQAATATGLGTIPTGAIGVTPTGGNITTTLLALPTSALNYTEAGPVFPTETTSCVVTPCSILGAVRNLRNPSVISWDLDIQHQLTDNLSLDVAYVGNHGRNLQSVRDINQVNQDSPLEGANGCNHCEQAGRPYASEFPFLAFINQLGNLAISNYNGLQVTLTQHASHGVDFLAGYTYSHSLNAPDFYAGMPFPQNSNDLAAEYGNSRFNMPNRFTFSITYAVPGIDGFGQILKGWHANSVVTLESGTPWSMVDASDDISLTGELEDRWDIYGSPSNFKTTSSAFIYCTGTATTVTNCTGPTPSGFLSASQAASDYSQCLSHAETLPFGPQGQTGVQSLVTFGCYASGNGKSVIVPPSLGTFGTSARDNFQGPGLYDWDASIFKNFTIERVTAEFRAEFFNMLNHPTLGNAELLGDNDVSQPGVFGCGCATSDVTASNPLYGSGGNRAIQLGLKLTF